MNLIVCRAVFLLGDRVNILALALLVTECMYMYLNKEIKSVLLVQTSCLLFICKTYLVVCTMSYMYNVHVPF